MFTKRPQPIEQNTTDVRILANFIKLKLIDEKAEIVTYAEMMAAVGGRDIQKSHRYILTKAVKEVEKTHDVFIGTVFDTGISIVTDLAGAADKAIHHIGMTAKRQNKRILRAVKDDIPKAEQVLIFARISTFGALVVCTKPAAVKKIEARLAETGQKELPTADTLRLFEK